MSVKSVISNSTDSQYTKRECERQRDKGQTERECERQRDKGQTERDCERQRDKGQTERECEKQRDKGQKKELELYNHIVKYWKEEYYKKCKQEWKDVEQFILPETFTSGFMCNCGTKWSDKKFINDELKICCYCDTYVQPFLSNPLNKINVLKYIPEKYHSDILIEYRCISCKDVCEYDVKSYYNNTPYIYHLFENDLFV